MKRNKHVHPAIESDPDKASCPFTNSVLSIMFVLSGIFFLLYIVGSSI